MGERKRKDQWTSADDEVLADIVLRAVQEGRTQLEAFQEAAIALGRTKQACGFRWNKTLRVRYGQSLQNYKKKPKQIVRSHLKIALTNFDELMEAYQQLERNYRELQTEHEKIVKWLQQGMRYTAKELLEKEKK